MPDILMKQPAEELAPALPFSGYVDELVELSVLPRGLAVGPALVAVPSLAAGRLTVRLAGGVDGERYLVTASAHVGDELLEAELEVVVVEAAWSMPDGGAPMLTIADFVRRVTLEEAIRMTEAPEAPGRIDRGLLISALVDAQAEVEASLSARFQLPLATVPIVVEAIVADLARVRLYPKGAPEGVAAAAKGAQKRLEKIATGELRLGLPEVTAAPTDAPVAVSPGRRQYPDGLADY